MNISYIAGFFDGEGSIVINKKRVRLTIPQTNKEVLEKIRDFFEVGGITTVKKRQLHWKQSWTYYSGSNKASLKILREIKDHLIIKKDLAEKALFILETSFTENNNKKLNIEKAINLVSSGKSYREIEKITGVSRQTICNRIKLVRGAA